MTTTRVYIYPYNWWSGFMDKRDANHIGFFEELFSYTTLKNFEITTDLGKANVLLEAGKPDPAIKNRNQWLYTINFIGEPVLPDADQYTLALTGVQGISNVVDLPLAIMYIHCNRFLPTLQLERPILSVPSSFCTFIVSNSTCATRNKLFERLTRYKRVNSMGSYANNTGGSIRARYWSSEYFHVLGQHKFMICGENTKMASYSTEKIVNPYMARTIPIYWGTPNIHNIFSADSMLYLEDESDEAFDRLVARVIELDNDDAKYLEFINRPIFNERTNQYWKDHYTLEALGKKIDSVLQ